MVVDDDPDILALLRLQLNQLGYAVTTVTSGAQAVEKLATEPPSLILLDLKLPRMTGLEVLRHVKQTSPETTVIVMTAYATVEKAVEAMKEGAGDLLPKPLTPGHLELVVRKAVEGQALQRAHRLAQDELAAKTQPILGESPAIQEVIARARRPEPVDGAFARGERDWQGSVRSGHSRLEPAASAAVRRGQLRGAGRGANRQ
ncbi:MAG TPA: response regulator [Candidatus Methylomirabilis sp.]|nr:response regulator [Candidatus Methylomirabilis sp.]